MIYYHGTSKENANKIKEHGINSLESKYDGKIYLTTNYAEASKYGKIASNGKPGIVLKIHSDALTPEHIHSSNSGIIEYKGNIHKDHISEETNVGMIAGTGDSRLPADQREPALNINIKNNKKILRRRKLTTHLDEISRGLLARYVKKAGGLGLDSISQKGFEYGKGEGKLKRAKGIERAADRLAKEDVDQLDEKILASKTAYVENPKSGFRRIKGLTGEEKKHIDNFGTVVFDSKKPEDGRKGNTWRRVVKGGRGSYYPRKLSNNELPLVHKEDASELINSVIDQSPSNFYNIFSEIVNAKIDRYIDVMNEDIAADLFESNRLDELSRGTLMNYIRAANARGHAERIMQGQKEADRTYYATGRRTKDKDFFRDQSEKKSNQHGKKAWQREVGIDRAIDRLAKKDAE